MSKQARPYQGSEVPKLKDAESISKAVLFTLQIPDRHPFKVGSDGILGAVLIVPLCVRLMVLCTRTP